MAQESRTFDISSVAFENWVNKAKRGMENALRAKPMEISEQLQRQLKELHKAYVLAMMELRARKKLSSLLGADEK